MTPEPTVPVKEESKPEQPAKAAGKWHIKQAPRFSPAYLHPDDGAYWETEYTDGTEVLIAQGASSERSRANADNAINRRNK